MGGWTPCCGDGELILLHRSSWTGFTIEKVKFGEYADKSWREVGLADTKGSPYAEGRPNATGWRYWIRGDDFLPEITREFTYPEDYEDVWYQGPFAGSTYKAPAPFSLIDAKVNDASEIFCLIYGDSTFFDPESPFPYQYFVQVLSANDGTYIRTIKLRETYSGGGSPSHFGCHMPYGWWVDYDNFGGWPLPSPYPPSSGGPRVHHYQLSVELVLGHDRLALNAPYVRINYDHAHTGPRLFESPYVQMWDYEGNLVTQVDRSSYHVFPSSNPNNDWAAMPLGCGYHLSQRGDGNYLLPPGQGPQELYPVVFDSTDSYYLPTPVDINARQPAVFDPSDNLYFIGGIDEWDYATDADPEPFNGIGESTCYNYSRHWDGQLENAATCYGPDGSKAWDYNAETSMAGRLFAVGIKIHPNTGDAYIQVRQNLFDKPNGRWFECKGDTTARALKPPDPGEWQSAYPTWLGDFDWQNGPSMFYFDYAPTNANGGNEDAGYYLFQEPDDTFYPYATPSPGSTIGGYTLSDPRLFSRTKHYTPHDQEIHIVKDGSKESQRPLNYKQRHEAFYAQEERVRRVGIGGQWTLSPTGRCDSTIFSACFLQIKSGSYFYDGLDVEPRYQSGYRLPGEGAGHNLLSDADGYGPVFGTVAPSTGFCIPVHSIEIDSQDNIFLFCGRPGYQYSGWLATDSIFVEQKLDPRGNLIELEPTRIVPQPPGNLQSTSYLAYDQVVGQAFRRDRMYTVRVSKRYGSTDQEGIFEYDTSEGQFKLINALRVVPKIGFSTLSKPGYVHHLHPLTGSNTGPFK